MNLKANKVYRTKNGGLKIQVNKIKYKGTNYTKAHLTIFNLNGTYLETIRNAKLYHDKINHWELA